MISSMKAIKSLKDFRPRHKYFVGVDSDGCVFDSMVIKQRECFNPLMIEYFGLQPVAEAAMQCKDFVDLFSNTRGVNRHKSVVRILTELLPVHPRVLASGFKVPVFRHYCEWVNDAQSRLNNAGLCMAVAQAKTEEAKKELLIALQWSRHVDQSVGAVIGKILPFHYARESLEKISKIADIVIVSVAPCETLNSEWERHDLAQYISAVAGQEMGSKKECMHFAANGRYAFDHIIMIGDAPGDMAAAKANDALFYPINPGHEVQSWKYLLDEAFDKFVDGVYAGDYEAKLIAEFEASFID